VDCMKRLGTLNVQCCVTAAERAKPENIEVGMSQMSHDRNDRLVVKNIYRDSPFRFSEKNKLVSTSSGVTASAKCMVSCDMADDIVFAAQKKWDNKSFVDVSFPKTDQEKDNVSDE